MPKLLSIIFFALLFLITLKLKKTYNHISSKELKRRARSGDSLAKLLHRAVSYGTSLNIFLWLVSGVSAGVLFFLLSKYAPGWFAILASIFLLWAGFAWLPNTRVSAIDRFTAKIFTPFVAWCLRKLQPVLGRVSLFLKSHSMLEVHSGLYEKQDIIDLLNKQKNLSVNRITSDEIRIASGALKFSDKIVRDVMTPRRVVKLVNITDSVGPILLNELHVSGHSRFPVYETKKDNIVGILYLHDLLDVKSSNKVRELMKSQLHYVNEELDLGHVLQAILKTKHHLFVVVNSFEEFVGVITIEDILEQVIGKPIMDEFDKFEDLREVANLTAQKEKAEYQELPEPEK